MFNKQTIIKTGICSYGMSGKLFHAPFIEAHPDFELTAIVERNKNESKEKYPKVELYRSVEEMLADATLQLIIVNTPTHTHYEYVKAALQKGKHVIVEKPFTVLVKEAEELNALAQKNNLLLSIYHNRRYDGDYIAVKKIIEENILGELREVEIRYDRYRTSASGKQHKEGSLPGAGTLYDLGSHLIDQALQLFGMPDALFADLATMRENVEAVDYFELLFFYKKMRVRLKATVIARETYYAYIVHGMKGSFLHQRSDRQEEQLLEGIVPSVQPWCAASVEPNGILHTEINGEVIRKEMTSPPGNYMDYFTGIHKALTGQAGNPVPAADAIQTAEIIEAAVQSAKEKRVVSLIKK
jgi:scyllo-inositol 2-dehydrogenase (NADP+)